MLSGDVGAAMNVLLAQQIVRHDLHDRIEDMAERAIYLCHMDTLNALEAIAAQASFEIRSIAQKARWTKFNGINRIVK